MTVVEILLVLAVTPAAIYGLVALLVLWPKFARARYRAGQDWEFAPVFWVANPAGVSGAPTEVDTARAAQLGTARGGARGNW